MKDSPIIHKFNKKLLFYVVLIIVVAFAAAFFYYKQRGGPGDLSFKNKKTEQAKEKQAAKDLSYEQDNLEAALPVEEVTDEDHLWGEASAPVKLIVYDDFECPFCAKFRDTLRQVKNEFGEKVLIVFRHYPLTTIHPYALPAALASECAGEQGQFWQMYDKLFEDNQAERMNAAQFKEDAASLGLDQAKFNQCLESEKYKDKIYAQFLAGRNANVNGTPTIFLNGQILVGAYPLDDFTTPDGSQNEGLRKLINEQLGK